MSLLKSFKEYKLRYTLFYKHSVFKGQPRYAYETAHFSLISCLQYAHRNRICDDGPLM